MTDSPATQFEALARAATQGEVGADQNGPLGHKPVVWSDYANVGMRGWQGKCIAVVGNMEPPQAAQDEWEANAAFIAFCFNHRALIAAALRGGEDGWVSVPSEVTIEMQRAYFAVIDKNMARVETDARFGRHSSNAEAYRAMLAAAPLPPSPGAAGRQT